MFIKKGDTVKILAGKDQGKTGKVLHVSEKSGKATVEGRNIYVHHQKPKKSGEKGQKIQLPKPINVSKLMLVCPHCAKPARIGRITDEKGIKIRICKKCKKQI